MRRAPLAALALTLAPAGCGDGDGGGAALPPCTLDAGVTTSLTDFAATEDNSNISLSPMQRNVFLEVFLDEDTVDAPDIFHLELYGGQGLFKGGLVRTGTFSLSGAEGAYDTCGACLLLLVDRAPDTLRPAAYYMPTRGTLVLDAVSDRLAGRLENVVLEHVTIDLDDPDGNGPLKPTLATKPASSCEITLGKMTFELPYGTPETPDAGG